MRFMLKNVFYWHLFCYHTEVCIFLDTFVFGRNKIFIWVLQMQAQIFYLVLQMQASVLTHNFNASENGRLL